MREDEVFDPDSEHDAERRGAQDLADLAADLGFDRDEVVDALESERYLPAVKADVAQADAYGISGVPFFVFEERYGVSGAQDTTVFADVLRQLSAEKETAA